MANRPARIGKYEITDVIGEGGMGAVYKGTDPRIGRTVAIKVIKGDFADNPELLRRFYQEAQAVGNLQHPNIVVVHDLGEENGSPYLVMEYVNGTPLDKIIVQRRSVPIVQKLGIVIEVLNALHYAHQHNLVHRDVKPANVMVLKEDHIKLLDFGIARQGDLGQTKTNQLMGTMWYMSPEQLNGQVVDGRSDVFSTGILLFELLAYSLPFSTNDMTYVVKRLKGDPPPPLSTYLQSYPVELDEIIARSLTSDREHRYSTAEEFAFDLGQLQARLKRDMVSHYVDQARESIERSDLTKARDLLSEVLRVDTQNQTAKQLLYDIQQTLQKSARNEKKSQLREQAVTKLAAKELDAAANLADEAIRLDQTDTDLLNLREQIELAKARAQQVKKLLTLAKVAQQTGELAVAKKALDDALALDPQDTDAKLMRSAIDRLMVEYEKQRQIQQFLGAARREIESRQFTAAQENIAKAKAIDAAYPEIAGLDRMLNAGREQEARQHELAQFRSQIEQELGANHARAARDIAASAMRKFPGEPNLIRMKSVADAAIEKEERRAYIDERIATASRLVEGGEANRAFRLLKDVEREYPADTRLRESIAVVQQSVARETAAREKQQFLQHARNAMRTKAFGEAIRLLEGGLVQFPEDSEIKDLLKTAREEFDLLSKKKQVEQVSKQAHDLLQSRAHTDAIRLLERTSAQVSDPELVNLLQYARQEAANFRAAVQDASEQATQMLNLGQPSEAVTFLEAHADKYGKNADFQVLLEQARKQAKEAERARQRLLGNLRDARARLRSLDMSGAEALLRVCELENPNEPDVLALAIEIEEEKKAAERRHAEAERAAKEQAERRRAEAERLAQEKAEAERRERESALEREARAAAAAAVAAPAFDIGGKTVLDSGSDGVMPTVSSPLDGSAPSVAAARVVEEPSMSATQVVGAHAGHAVESAVLTPPPIEVAPPAPPPAPPKREEPRKKRKGKAVEVSPAALEPVIAPVPEKPLESPPLSMPTIVAEPKPVAPPRPPERSEPLPVQPPEVGPPSSKRTIFIAGGAAAVVVLAVVTWFLVRQPTAPNGAGTSSSVATKTGTPETTQPPKPTTATLKIIGAPPNAKFRLGGQDYTVGVDGTAEVDTKPGTYAIEMNAPDYKPYSGSVTLELGNNEPLTPALVPLRADNLGTLIVKANVDHFDVLVDGKLKSNSGKGQQVKVDNLPEGPHKVLIKKSGYLDPKEQPVKIVAKQDSKPILFSVEKNPEVIAPPSSNATAGASPPTSTSPSNVTPPVVATSSAPPPPPVTVPPKPVITSFQAEPITVEAGGRVKLTWSIQGADKVKIAPDNVTLNASQGNFEASPKEPQTRYELTAIGSGGEATSSLTVTVRPKSDESSEVVAARERWRSAYESLDMAKVRAAFPNIPPDLAAGIQKLGKDKRQISVAYTGCTEPRTTGDMAEMQCTESVSVIVNGQKIPPQPKKFVLQFIKQGNIWVLNARK